MSSSHHKENLNRGDLALEMIWEKTFPTFASFPVTGKSILASTDVRSIIVGASRIDVTETNRWSAFVNIWMIKVEVRRSGVPLEQAAYFSVYFTFACVKLIQRMQNGQYILERALILLRLVPWIIQLYANSFLTSKAFSSLPQLCLSITEWYGCYHL